MVLLGAGCEERFFSGEVEILMGLLLRGGYFGWRETFKLKFAGGKVSLMSCRIVE